LPEIGAKGVPETLMIGSFRVPLMAIGAVAILSAGVFALGGTSSPSAAGATAPPTSMRSTVATVGSAAPDGQAIWSQDCAFCHGVRGEGSFQGPSITASGTAAVDFMVRTGRMPSPFRAGAEGDLLSDPPPAQRGRHASAYSDEQIRALVDFTAGFVSGPAAVAPPDTAGADLGRGGELYRLQCSACHQMAGSGGALAYGAVGPALDQATPREAIEAMRVGPGNMPIFDRSVISDAEAVDVAAYVEYLHHPEDRGGADLWHLGPVPEGLVAWLVGIGGLVLFCRWLGERQKVRTR
jgi:ubiquinol-cytochrome c reductase cytochrome c subunit